MYQAKPAHVESKHKPGLRTMQAHAMATNTVKLLTSKAMGDRAH